MYFIRKVLVVALLALLSWAAWSSILGGGKESAGLRVFDTRGNDHFATVWVVDDDVGLVWIRAHRPTRKWLSLVRQNAEVELRRGGVSRIYVATVTDNPDARAYVAPLFRSKYGLADLWRELTSNQQTIPVKLQPR